MRYNIPYYYCRDIETGLKYEIFRHGGLNPRIGSVNRLRDDSKKIEKTLGRTVYQGH